MQHLLVQKIGKVLTYINVMIPAYSLKRKEGGWEGEREREKHGLATSSVPQLGIKPATFWGTRRCANQLSHLARVEMNVFNIKFS